MYLGFGACDGHMWGQQAVGFSPLSPPPLLPPPPLSSTSSSPPIQNLTHTVVSQQMSLLLPWWHAGSEVVHKGKPDKSPFEKENRVILSLRVGKNDAENPGWACSPVVGWNTVPAERGVTSDSVRRAAARGSSGQKRDFFMLLLVLWQRGNH